MYRFRKFNLCHVCLFSYVEANWFRTYLLKVELPPWFAGGFGQGALWRGDAAVCNNVHSAGTKIYTVSMPKHGAQKIHTTLHEK